ncbi:MAG TPA: FtsX-like permease family protein [Thermoleophilaceae bacterium]
MTGLPPILRLALRRARERPLPLLLAALGIAAGVALMFSLLLVHENLAGSGTQVERELAGGAEAMLLARSPEGVEQSVYDRVASTPGVRAAAPVSERQVTLSAGSRRVEARLFGIDRRALRLGGPVVRATLGRVRDESALGVYLPRQLAGRLGVEPGGRVAVETYGRIRPAGVRAIPDEERLRAAGDSRVAVAPLGLAQRLTGDLGRLNRVLVQFEPGQAGAAREALEASLGDRLDLRPIDAEAGLLAQASAPERQATLLFSAIALVVGTFLAYNVVLLAVLDRRREIALMRAIGVGPRALVAGILAEALAIGVVGTSLGLVVGKAFVAELVDDTPEYLRSAFVFEPPTRVPARAIAMASVAGLAASLVAAALPTLALLRVPATVALEAEHVPEPQRRGGRPARIPGLAAAVLLAAGTAIALLVPSLAVAGIALLLVGVMLALPAAVPGLVRLLRRHLLDRAGAAAHVGGAELTTVPARTIALAGIACVTALALGVVGGVVRNVETASTELLRERASADMTISNRRASNIYQSDFFPAAVERRVAQAPGVRSTRALRAAFLDWHDRRVLFVGADPASFTPAQVVDRSPDELGRALRRPGAVAMSSALARRRGIEVGDSFALPTPTGPQRVTLAGKVTTYAWPPGAVAMSRDQLGRFWGTTAISGLDVELEPGVPVERARTAVEHALGPGSTLSVETRGELHRRLGDAARQGLARLRGIVVMVVLAAFLAVTATMTLAAAQRVRSIAGLRALGMSPRQATAALVAEALAVVGIGAAIGVAAGTPVQALAVHWIAEENGLPVHFSVEVVPMLVTIAISSAVALVAALVAARRALRVQPSHALAHP